MSSSYAASLGVEVRSSLERSMAFLFREQRDDGHWCGELEGDTILASEYILTMIYLGRGDDPALAKAAEHIRRQSLPDGAWAIYPGGPPEISASVKAYFVLKLLGDDPDAPPMRAAARVIRELGGIEACNSFTKIFLAIFGQYPWSRCPAVIPELILLPRWFYFNIYEMSSWSRAILIPLSIIWAHRPHRAVPSEADIRELMHGDAPPRPPNLPTTYTGRFWRGFFLTLNMLLQTAERGPWKPFRRRALSLCEQWVLTRLEESDGLGAIFPPIVNTIVAFDCLGYAQDDPALAGQIRELRKLEIDDGPVMRIQPCFSPVWDTSLILNSLLETDLPTNDPRLLQAGRFLLEKEVRRSGDWQVHNPDGPVGGWFFEYANAFYPDCDDTAEVLTGLHRLRFEDAGEQEACADAVARGEGWLRSMQNRDGGWAAFDCGCTKQSLTYVPFADHNAMIDPSNGDITGRVLKALRALGAREHDQAVEAGRAFLKRQQEPDGTWYGRWGCNHIYGSWLALWGLKYAGEDLAQPHYQRILDWLREHQNPDGGWGESFHSYEDPSAKGQGQSTAAQTAWALMIAFAFEAPDARMVERGVRYLLRTQRTDGSWIDEYWTATGFPKVFYLNYHLYATCFSLLALATYDKRNQHRPSAPSSVSQEESAVCPTGLPS